MISQDIVPLSHGVDNDSLSINDKKNTTTANAHRVLTIGQALF